jgi:hypothetical protein
VVKALFPGDVVTEIDCPGCGKTLHLKVTKGGNLGYFCQTVFPDVINPKTKKPQRCFTRLMFGSVASERLKAEFLEQYQKSEVVKTEKEIINVQPDREKEPAATSADGDTTGGTGGLAEAISSFIFG